MKVIVLLALTAVVATLACAGPTPTPDPCDAPDVTEFRQELGTVLEDTFAAVTEFGIINSKAAEDTTVIFSNSWQIAMGMALARFRGNADIMDNMQPPIHLQSLEEDIRGVAQGLREAAATYAQGLSDLDAELIAGSVQHLESIVDNAQAIGEKVTNLCPQG